MIAESQYNEYLNSLRTTLKSLTQGAYDMQKLRIAIGNRICQQYRQRMGLNSSDNERKLSSENKNILNQIRKEYKLLADGLIDSKNMSSVDKTLKNNTTISSFVELQLVREYMNILASEIAAFKNIETIIDQFPIWTKYLLHVRGIGPTLAAVLISKFDIYKARYVTSMWAYAGLGVMEYDQDGNYDGRGTGRYKEHLVEKEYVKSDGGITNTHGISFNSWLKTKLIGVLYDCLIKQNAFYRTLSNNYKSRLTNSPFHNSIIRREPNGDLVRVFPSGQIYTGDKPIPKFVIDKFERDPSLMEYEQYSKSHKFNMAKRYTVKIFIKDLYEAWKQIEGLKKEDPYGETHQGLQKHTEVRLCGDDIYRLIDLKTGKPVNYKSVEDKDEDLDDTQILSEEIKEPTTKKKVGRPRGQKISSVVKDKAAEKLREADSML